MTADFIKGSFGVSGVSGLRQVLGQADIIVTLLPKTPETENLLNAETLSWAKRGAVVINPGRGALMDDDALLAALAPVLYVVLFLRQ
jgi:glyoxylate/hydroxypyruvate reductase A